ncbi:lipopolysaccharide transport periplasmic protein LptA [Thiosulfativibrio zosterae]|uniref:Lipopolysaccharide export system protein LptA n=1 Tax=Thiosulfativibrio zosterae TaxID=2675053 RepID=A0A6F8PMA8_9GAMM|nr:lipopolysaccharide transport periplasmic protein LptA [Thiosulfativibrio zosterae]BBP43208.1 hypothetical protein THMIRHAT_09540 [Thiosulfativibrio zosterae]
MKYTLALTSKTRILQAMILSMLFSASGLVWAESSSETTKPDEEQPVEVIANRLDAAEKLGKSIYIGDVVITQGTTKITGDQVSIEHPLSVLESAVATGKPATFKRYSLEQQKWLTGHAEQITYNAKLKTLLFQGDALVEQEGENSIQGPEIFYDLTQKTLRAKGSGEADQRIKVIFTPQTPAETPSTPTPEQP